MAEKLSKAEEKAVEKAKATAVAVFLVDRAGNEQYVRTYSVSEHGERFLEYAEEYKKKNTKNGFRIELREDKR